MSNDPNPIIEAILNRLQGNDPGPIEADVTELKCALADVAAAEAVAADQYEQVQQALQMHGSLKRELIREIGKRQQPEAE